MKLVCIIALFLIASSGAVQEDNTPRTFCGRYLARARALYCYGLAENQRKRSAIKTSLILELLRPEKVDYPGYEVRNDDEGIFGEADRAKRVGLADECCLKPCYISDLLNYC